MNLLVTGAYNASQEQLNKFREEGYNLFFQKNEMGKPECDFKIIDGVICNGLFLYHDIEDFPNLKFIQLTSAGLDRICVDKVKEKNIRLFNAVNVYSIPMAEFAVAGVLSLYKDLRGFYENQKNHNWEKNRGIGEINGKKVAIVGFGSVGKECAKRFKAFGTEIIAVDIFKFESELYDEYFDITDIEQVLSTADIVVLTLPLTEDTRGFFNKDLFNVMRNTALLVTIARGATVNEKDLISALKYGQIGGAVLDVFENEPLDGKSELWDLENVLITPHNSFVSENNNTRLFNLIFNNLKKLAKGDF